MQPDFSKLNWDTVKQVFKDSATSDLGKLMLTVIGVGVLLLALTYLAPLIGILLLGVVIFFVIAHFHNG